MASSENSSDADRLAFDREKWREETALRAREIAVKEREIVAKEAEQKLSRWTNPLFVAVTVATVAWVGNVAATWWGGRLQRVLEEQKAGQQQRLEENKAESERILEMIKTGDPERAAVNLGFLLDAGLIATDERVTRLRDYLAKRRPNSGPVLPVAGGRFNIEQTEALTKPMAAILESDLRDFISYLDKVGFPAPPDRVRIKVEEMHQPNAYYDQAQKLIAIDRRIVDDTYPMHREYMHHLLFASKPNYEWASSVGDLENGLADYFSGSFTGKPLLGSASSSRVLGVARDYIRRLDNDRTYKPRSPEEQPHDRGEMWGGVFWDMRAKLGQMPADRALAAAWQSMPWPVGEPDIVPTFVKALLAVIETQTGPSRLPDVLAILRQRKIPVPN